MKRILVLLLMAIMIFVFMVGCKDRTHSETVEREGKLLVGITDFAPMNYKENGEWTGFDTEFAKLFAKEKFDAEVEFVEIEWTERFEALDNGEVDCLWNGVVLADRFKDKADFSNPYLKNAQVLVLKADRVADYDDGFQIRNLKFAVVKGSEGAFYVVDRNGFKNATEVETRDKALEMVSKGEVDAAVIDLTTANFLTGEGKKYSDLGIGFDFSSESYRVAFPDDSDMTEIFNEFLDEVGENELKSLAQKYGVTLY